MTTTLTGIEPIPVEFILGIAQSKATQAQRRPYIELIVRWGDEMNRADEACQLLERLRKGQVIDPRKMPHEFQPRYRQPEVAARLIEIVRHINDVIASKQENWTWAHVMRVMTDEGIIFGVTHNKFDSIICSMIPGKGLDTVRPFWPNQSYINPKLAAARSICNQIALEFAPVLNRKILVEF